jgi:uncharacterized protein (DUF58 family)
MNAPLLAIATGVLFFLAVGSGMEILFRLAYTALGAFLVGFAWRLVGLRGISVERHVKANRGQVGEEIEETLTVVNSSALPRPWVTVSDFSTLPGHRASRVVSVGPKGSYTWRVKTSCQERGGFRLGPTIARVGDPFGLFEKRQRAGGVQNVVVYPATSPLPNLSFGGGSLRGGASRREHADYITTNAAGIREYAPGDAYSRIHWFSTARTNRLMVKEFEPDPIADVWIALDMDAAVHAGQHPENTEEYAVHAAASLARHFLASGWAVGLLSRAEQHHDLPPERGDRQMTKLLEELAVIHATGFHGLGELLVSEGVRFGRHSLVIAITPSTEVVWTTALRSFSDRGIRSLALLIDASTFASDLDLDSESDEERHLGGVVAGLAVGGIPVHLYKRGDRLTDVFVNGVSGVA